MGLYCQINLESDWGFPNRTPELGLPIDYTEAINVFSDTFMGVSQEMVPVDTGFLKSSLNSFGSGMIIEAEATADYAQYVEYGTWCCEAQPYFNPAIESASDASFGVARKIYNEAIKREAELVQQQYMAKAQSMVVSAFQGMGAGSIFGGLLSLFIMMVIVSIATLFSKFFSDIFGDNEE